MTVEEFFEFINGEIAYPPDFAHRKAIEFAKYHVEQALKSASENAKCTIFEEVFKESILNAYPETNII